MTPEQIQSEANEICSLLEGAVIQLETVVLDNDPFTTLCNVEDTIGDALGQLKALTLKVMH
jgi:hypothetical protein